MTTHEEKVLLHPAYERHWDVYGRYFVSFRDPEDFWRLGRSYVEGTSYCDVFKRASLYLVTLRLKS